MENKILVNLLVPVIDESYDILIPVGKTVEDTINLLKESVSKLSMESLEGSNIELYNSDGKILDRNTFILNSGISNGSKIILI